MANHKEQPKLSRSEEHYIKKIVLLWILFAW